MFELAVTRPSGKPKDILGSTLTPVSIGQAIMWWTYFDVTASNYAVIVRFSGGGEAQRQIFGTLEGKRELKVKEASE